MMEAYFAYTGYTTTMVPLDAEPAPTNDYEAVPLTLAQLETQLNGYTWEGLSAKIHNNNATEEEKRLYALMIIKYYFPKNYTNPRLLDLHPEKLELLIAVKSRTPVELSRCGKHFQDISKLRQRIIPEMFTILGIDPTSPNFIRTNIPIERVQALYSTGGTKANLETILGIKIPTLSYRSFIAKLHTVFKLMHLDIERVRSGENKIVTHYTIIDPFGIWNDIT